MPEVDDEYICVLCGGAIDKEGIALKEAKSDEEACEECGGSIDEQANA